MTSPELDVYDLAYLAGGPDRVVDTAVVALVRGGQARVHSPGRLAAVGRARGHPVEAAVLDAVGATGHRSVDVVRSQAVRDDRLRDVGRRLHDRKLVGRGLRPRSGGVLTATRAGRTALAESGDLLGVDGEVVRVARGGRAAMSGKRLRADLFEPPYATPVLPRSDRPGGRDSVEEAVHWSGGGTDDGGF
jgi:hypothetical protein